MFTLFTTYPPSINHYYGTRRGGGRFVKEPGLAYRREVKMMWKAFRAKPFEGSVAVAIVLLQKDKRHRDIDNGLKCILDALQHAGCYANDRQVVRLIIEKKPQRKYHNAEIRIWGVE